MEEIQRARTSGRCCRSWPCQMARIRTLELHVMPQFQTGYKDVDKRSGARSTEDYSYFTLRHEATESKPATSLFGISCTRQMDAAELINRPAEVTRSTVQKAVVVICDTPQYFTSLREKLGFVTRAWFSQKDFTDLGILRVGSAYP